MQKAIVEYKKLELEELEQKKSNYYKPQKSTFTSTSIKESAAGERNPKRLRRVNTLKDKNMTPEEQ
jgi:hypothetical protein